MVDLLLHYFHSWLTLQTEQTMVVLRVLVEEVKLQNPEELERTELVSWAHPCFFYEESQPWTLWCVDVRNEDGNNRH